MLRLSSLIGAALMLGLSANVFAAENLKDFYPTDFYPTDFSPDELRGAYPQDWGFSQEPDPLEFEVGLRYWYSMGSSAITAFGGAYSASDISQIAEAFFRIDDNSTSSYLKGQVGYAIKIDGTYITPEFVGAQNMAGGYIGYAGVDFGMLPFGNETIGFGAFAGYQFITDNPDMGRSTFITAAGGGDSQTNMLEIHAAKIGVAMNADIGDKIDLSVEAAIIPYASLGGTYGAFYAPDFVVGADTFTQGSAGTLNGRLYGASGEALLGFNATDNLTLRAGVRGWYLTGDATMEYVARNVATPATSQSYIGNVTGLEFFRYGALAEIAGKF